MPSQNRLAAKLAIVMPPTLLFLVFLGLWEVVVRLFDIPVFILPAPTVVWGSLLRWHRALWIHAVQTLYTTLLGFLLAMVTGIVLGALVAYAKFIYSALYPLLVGFNSVPRVALVPLLVIWFGIGTVPAILTAFLISFFPIVVNMATGLATVEPELTDLLRSLGASKREIFLKVGIHCSLPYLFASLKVAVTLAFIGSVIAETIAANKGIGYVMVLASARFDTPLVFAGLVVIAGMGVALYAVFALLENRFTPWAYRGRH